MLFVPLCNLGVGAQLIVSLSEYVYWLEQDCRINE